MCVRVCGGASPPAPCGRGGPGRRAAERLAAEPRERVQESRTGSVSVCQIAQSGHRLGSHRGMPSNDTPMDSAKQGMCCFCPEEMETCVLKHQTLCRSCLGLSLSNTSEAFRQFLRSTGRLQSCAQLHKPFLFNLCCLSWPVRRHFQRRKRAAQRTEQRVEPFRESLLVSFGTANQFQSRNLPLYK